MGDTQSSMSRFMSTKPEDIGTGGGFSSGNGFTSGSGFSGSTTSSDFSNSGGTAISSGPTSRFRSPRSGSSTTNSFSSIQQGQAFAEPAMRTADFRFGRDDRPGQERNLPGGREKPGLDGTTDLFHRFSPAQDRAQQSLADTAIREGTVSGMKGMIDVAIRDSGEVAQMELGDLSRRIGQKNPALAREVDAMTRDAIMRERPDLLRGPSTQRGATRPAFARNGQGASFGDSGVLENRVFSAAADGEAGGGTGGGPQDASGDDNRAPSNDEPAQGTPIQSSRPDDGSTLPSDAVESVPIQGRDDGVEGIIDPASGGFLRDREGNPFPAPNDGTTLRAPDVGIAKEGGSIAEELYARINEGTPLTAVESRDFQQRIENSGIEDPLLKNGLNSIAENGTNPDTLPTVRDRSEELANRASNPTFHAKVRENEEFLSKTDAHPGGRDAYTKASREAWDKVGDVQMDWLDSLREVDRLEKEIQSFEDSTGATAHVERQALDRAREKLDGVTAEYQSAIGDASKVPPPPHLDIDSDATRPWGVNQGGPSPYDIAGFALGMMSGGTSLLARMLLMGAGAANIAASAVAHNRQEFLSNLRAAHQASGGDSRDPIGFSQWVANNPDILNEAASDALESTAMGVGISFVGRGVSGAVLGSNQAGESLGTRFIRGVGKAKTEETTNSILEGFLGSKNNKERN